MVRFPSVIVANQIANFASFLAWIAYKGKVYDVSNWETHPGGSVIFTHAGDDATDIFVAFHPASASNDLKRFEIGELDESLENNKDHPKFKSQKQADFEKAYRELRRKILTQGLFNASLPYYAFKIASNLAILYAGCYLAMNFNSLFMRLVGATLVGLFWQQCGWLAHDFLHHQVFKNRVFGDIAGLIIGDLFQGFSVQWWKSKHNSHHAVPNLLASVPGACDGDPDIDTMPFLAWTLKMAEIARDSEFGRSMIKYQAFLYFPLLLFARLAWAHQSWVFIWGGAGQHSVAAAYIDRKYTQYPTAEKVLLVLHYVFFFWVMSHMPILHAVAFFLWAQMSCGLMLALVFGLGHNGMAVYAADARPDFWKLQVTTTRNVTSNWFSDWFCGGLQYQVEHHLFPSLPRHNLGKVHKMVEQFCKEQGVNYHENDMINGNIEVLQHLAQVTKEFLKEFPGM
jgi:fatty acid desaturase/predicted heme/steroid binding protein